VPVVTWNFSTLERGMEDMHQVQDACDNVLPYCRRNSQQMTSRITAVMGQPEDSSAPFTTR
jgi:hypothetical protein